MDQEQKYIRGTPLAALKKGFTDWDGQKTIERLDLTRWFLAVTEIETGEYKFQTGQRLSNGMVIIGGRFYWDWKSIIAWRYIDELVQPHVCHAHLTQTGEE